MSSFAVDGLVSGLDTTALIGQLMQIERIPRNRLQNQVTQQTSTITAYQAVASALKKLDDAARALTDTRTWTGVTASVTGDALAATAKPGAPTAPVDVWVEQLATATAFTTQAAYRLEDQVVPAPTIDVTRADGTLVSLQPASGSLQDVMSAINSADGLGVRAVAVRVSTDTYRLQIVSTTTGAAGGPTSITGFAAGDLVRAAGQDAQYRVGSTDGTGGIVATSPSNSIIDLVTGVDATLRRPGAASIALAADTPTTVSAVEALVTAANDAIAVLKKQTATDPNASSRGPLASDTQVRALTGRIVQAVTDALGGASAATVGLQSTRDGTLVLDKETLGSALAADPAAVRGLLAPADGGPGVVARLRAVVDAATNAGSGFITTAIQGRETTKRDLQTQIDSWDRRLELRKATLQRQFSALEVSLGRLNSQSSWLAGQLAGLNAGLGRDS
ncbi:flagellar filament capping protein FliD [Aquipuribacter nitratireducens]|uniref:Flagellar hook-associated protein 2 n=1 Tax=Aquipuribacter nitratireducens TaxID=650104 RepID=A0ABW0GRA7_9MICO